jgi:tetratricopeptide (TPR) repeat protein
MTGLLVSMVLCQSSAIDRVDARSSFPKLSSPRYQLAREDRSARHYFKLGVAKSNSGDFNGAIANFERAISLQERSANELNPKLMEAYYNRATAKFYLGRKQEAVADYDLAIALDPKFSMAYNNRGNTKKDLGQLPAAIKDFDRAIALNPKNDKAYYNRGSAKSALGQKEASIADFDRAIALNAYYAQAYNNRGNAKFFLERFEAALSDFDRTIAIDPTYIETYNNRGAAKLALERTQEALIDFDRAILLLKKSPSSTASNLAEYLYNRGSAKSILGLKQAAIVDLAQLNQFLQTSLIFLNLTNFYKLVTLLGDYLDRLQILMAYYGVIQPSESRSPTRSSYLRTLLATNSRDSRNFRAIFGLHFALGRRSSYFC